LRFEVAFLPDFSADSFCIVISHFCVYLMCPPFTGATISDGGLEPNRAKVKSEENCASFYAFSIDTISVDVGMRPGHIGCTTGKASD